MRRRPKVLLLDDGKPWDGIIPAWTLAYQPGEWPGYHPWEQWDAWWGAANEWAAKHMPGGFDELRDHMTKPPSRPWNAGDI